LNTYVLKHNYYSEATLVLICISHIQEVVVNQCVPVESMIDALLSVLGRVIRSHDPLTISEHCLTSVISLLDHVILSVDHVILDKMLIRLLPYLLYCRLGDVNVTQSLAASLTTTSLAHYHPLLTGCDELLSSHGNSYSCHGDNIT